MKESALIIKQSSVPTLGAILTEVEALAVIGFHFPVENYILRENISGYPFRLDVQMKKSHVVKSFSHSTGFAECPLFKVQVSFHLGIIRDE